MVRASSHKTIFDKGYMPNWTKEHFTVIQAVPPRKGTKRRIYKLVDYNDEDVIGSWYSEELREISDNQYRIKNVLRRRTLPNGTKRNICSVGRLARKTQLVDNGNRQVLCRR